MSETTVMQTDLDRLGERVEKAALLIQKLREDHDRLARERETLTQRLQDLERQLQGQDASVLVTELSALRREQREWQTERREITQRVELMLSKLERLDG